MSTQALIETLLEETAVIVHQAREGVPRQLHFPQSDQMIKVAIGMRRSGKSYFLYQTINALLTQGVHASQILLVNFEDERLLPMSAKEMGELLDSFYSLYPENHNRRCYLFLDEVQNIPDWHQVVRRYYDTKNAQLFLTGSSAKLLSKEIATSLRGRSLAIEVWPYSFNEYLMAHQLDAPIKPFGQKAFDIMQAHLLSYFATGGFPAVQNMPKNEWRETLQTYVDTVILRDIVERHKVSNITLLKYLINSLLSNAAAPFSVNKFYNDIKSQGYKVAKDTIHSYMDYIEDAYLAFTVPLYSESTRAKQNSPKKVYAVDSGLIYATSMKIKDIYGKLLENLVYLDLRREGRDIYFYTTSGGYEVDFVTVDKSGEREIIQVAWDVKNPVTLEREQRALQQAEQELGIPGRLISLRDYLRQGV
jgi:uncharacterized protein